jgi:hypothetical protein
VFLHLQAVREDVDHAGYLAQTHNVAARYVGYVYFPEEGQDMVFAERIKFDVLDYNHLVVVFMEHGRTKCGYRIHVVAFGEFEESPSHSLRCAYKPFTFRVFPDGFKAFATCAFQYLYLFFSIHFC